ncbi:hypothetical protein HX744_08840, partial [Pseudonocardia sp. ICBG1122]|nr:hypothetical protein [Pseudonocardia pini]
MIARQRRERAGHLDLGHVPHPAEHVRRDLWEPARRAQLCRGQDQVPLTPHDQGRLRGAGERVEQRAPPARPDPRTVPSSAATSAKVRANSGRRAISTARATTLVGDQGA